MRLICPFYHLQVGSLCPFVFIHPRWYPLPMSNREPYRDSPVLFGPASVFIPFLIILYVFGSNSDPFLNCPPQEFADFIFLIFILAYFLLFLIGMPLFNLVPSPFQKGRTVLESYWAGVGKIGPAKVIGPRLLIYLDGIEFRGMLNRYFIPYARITSLPESPDKLSGVEIKSDLFTAYPTLMLEIKSDLLTVYSKLMPFGHHSGDKVEGGEFSLSLKGFCNEDRILASIRRHRDEFMNTPEEARPEGPLSRGTPRYSIVLAVVVGGLLLWQAIAEDRFKNDHKALNRAVRKCDVAQAAAILDRNPALLNWGYGPMKRHNYSPLQQAVESRQLECCRLLLDRGAKVNGKGFDGPIPLSIAMGNKDLAIIKLLLQYIPMSSLSAYTISQFQKLAVESADPELIKLLPPQVMHHGDKKDLNRP
jgi:hypothetical protein